MLELQRFIQENENWFVDIQKPPYCIKVNEDEEFYTLNYSMLNSDFSCRLVQECRGIILDKKTLQVACMAFNKFFNYGEHEAATIDWNTAIVQEKMDGSLIKLWYYKDKWRVSTNKTIDAFKAPLSTFHIDYHTFGDLFISCFVDFDKFITNVDKTKTYMFELCSPFNQGVLKYSHAEIWHIGTRNMLNLQEEEYSISVQQPKTYPLHSLVDCELFVNNWKDHEGFVVRDANYNRIKIKTRQYLLLHHAINNHQMTKERILALVDSNDFDEFISYFPEYKESIYTIYNRKCEVLQQMEFHKYLVDTRYSAKLRKEFAQYVKDNNLPSYWFLLYDNKIDSVDEYYNSLSTVHKLKLLGV